jgi:hypothetical protein
MLHPKGGRRPAPIWRFSARCDARRLRRTGEDGAPILSSIAMLSLLPSRRIVQVPVGAPRFTGAVPACRALVFDARRGCWILRREDVGPHVRRMAPIGTAAPSVASIPSADQAGQGMSGLSSRAPAPRPSGGPGASRARALVLGALGALAGLGTSALVYRFGPVVSAPGGGSPPPMKVPAVAEGRVDVLAVLAKGPTGPGDPGPRLPVGPEAGVALAGVPMAHPGASAPTIPVPAFMLARVAAGLAGGRDGDTITIDAASSHASANGLGPAVPGRSVRVMAHGRGRRAPALRIAPKESGTDAAEEAPILNDARKTRDLVTGEATKRAGAAADRGARDAVAPEVDRLVAVKDAHTVLVPDARSGVPKAVRVGERLPSGAVLVSADPAAGRARTDRGELELQ